MSYTAIKHQYIQKQSRQILLSGLKLFYDHPCDPGSGFLCYAFFFPQTAFTTTQMITVITMSGRVLPTMISTFISIL